MKKREIIRVTYHSATKVSTIKSRLINLGADKPSNHPHHPFAVEVPGGYLSEPGDVIRCDGHLFSAKPAPIWAGERRAAISCKGEKVWKKVYTHKPKEVGNGFWVLRKVV